MRYQTFEDYLQDKHGEQYVGTDDMMPEDYEDWLMALDPQEIIDYAEQWGKRLTKNINKLKPLT